MWDHERDAPRHTGRACDVVVADWPYECKAKDKHPDHVVYRCREHLVWWHRPPAGQAS